MTPEIGLVIYLVGMVITWIIAAVVRRGEFDEAEVVVLALFSTVWPLFPFVAGPMLIAYVVRRVMKKTIEAPAAEHELEADPTKPPYRAAPRRRGLPSAR